MKKLLCLTIFAALSSLACAQTDVRVVITGPGGHSNGNYGRVNAVHAASNAIMQLTARHQDYVITNFSGGNSVNSIAGDARFVVRVPDGVTAETAKAEVSKAVQAGVDTENAFRGVKAGQKLPDGTDISVRFRLQ